MNLIEHIPICLRFIIVYWFEVDKFRKIKLTYNNIFSVYNLKYLIIHNKMVICRKSEKVKQCILQCTFI